MLSTKVLIRSLVHGGFRNGLLKKENQRPLCIVVLLRMNCGSHITVPSMIGVFLVSGLI